MRPLSSVLAVVVVGLATLEMAGCAERKLLNEPVAVPPRLQWPAPPAAPRVVYVREFSSADDLGIKQRGALAWLRRLAFGDQKIPLIKPMAVLSDGNRIFVADPGAHGVHRFDRGAGTHTLVTGANNSPMRSPVALALGRGGLVYVSDSASGRVLVIPAGSKTARELPTDTPLSRPTGIAFDPAAGTLTVVDTAAHQLLQFDESGRWLHTIGSHGKGDGQFNYPTHLWRDDKGHFLVTDALNFRVQILDNQGRLQGKFGQHGDGTGNIARHKGIASDSYGHVYLVDALFNAVQIFDAGGQYLLSFGRQGSGPGEFWLPAGLFIDAQDRIYVADAYNRRVQIFRYVGGAQ